MKWPSGYILTSEWGGITKLTTAEKKALLAGLYDRFYHLNQNALGPYFRSLYHVFKRIHNAKGLPAAEKIEYANIARSTLGKDAIFLLSLNCISDFGKEFLPLVEGYGLLKHADSQPDPTVDQFVIDWFYQTAGKSAADREAYWSQGSNKRPVGF